MIRIVPHDIDYNTIKKIESVAVAILYVSAAISIAVLILDKTNLIVPKDGIIEKLNSSLSIIAIAYFFLDIIQNYLFQQAELNRKNDFIDNSLSTQLSEQNSLGYFSNENFVSFIYDKFNINQAFSIFTVNIWINLYLWVYPENP